MIIGIVILVILVFYLIIRFGIFIVGGDSGSWGGGDSGGDSGGGFGGGDSGGGGASGDW